MNIDLQEFVGGYVECALWSSTDGNETPLDSLYGPRDIDAATIQEMVSDCAAFIEAQETDLERFGELTERDHAALGHDLWLTRNHHGAGYWDRYMEAPNPPSRAEAVGLGKLLTAAAEATGERYLEI